MSNSVADMQLFFMGLHETDQTFSCKNTDQLSSLWAAFTKCKRNIRDGFRLENMSWRLWYREAMMRKRLDTETSIVLPPQSTSATQQESSRTQQYTTNKNTIDTKQEQQPRLVRTRSLPSLSCQAQHMMETCRKPTTSTSSADLTALSIEPQSPNLPALAPALTKRSKFYIDQDDDESLCDDSFDDDDYDDDDDTGFSCYSSYASSSSSSSVCTPALDDKVNPMVTSANYGPLSALNHHLSLDEDTKDNQQQACGLRRSHCNSRLDQWFSTAITA